MGHDIILKPFQRLGRPLLAAVVWFAGLSAIALNAYWITLTDNFRDFGSFIASAQGFVDGQGAYATDNPFVFYVNFREIGLASYLVNLNSPLSLLLFAPLAQANPVMAFGVWRIISLLLYGVSAGMLLRTYATISNRFRGLWVLCLAGFWQTLELGQIYMPLLLVCTGAWLCLRSGRQIWAGLLLGVLIALKPNFVIWALFLLVSGLQIPVLIAVSSSILLAVIPLLLLGPDIYRQWWNATNDFAGMPFPGNSSLPGLFVRFGAPEVGVILALGLLVIMALLIHRRVSPIQASSTGLLMSLLAAPIAWAGYTLFLLPVFLSRRWKPLLKIAAVILSYPFPLILLSFQESRFSFVFFGWFYGWALLLVLIELVRERPWWQPKPSTSNSIKPSGLHSC